MRLQDIGFYTLSDERVKQVCSTSPMWRTEILITRACDFKCPYCRSVGCHKSLEEVKHLINLWSETGLKNIRFSGGEPTLHSGLLEMVAYARQMGAERIAISTNGNAAWAIYERLIEAGANDFSVSLDACCASEGDKMAGGVDGVWEQVVSNIRKLSALVYTTVGIVVTPENVGDLTKTVLFAHELGVADIRVITAAQWDEKIKLAIPQRILDQHPILNYRIQNIVNGKAMRGLRITNSNRCGLAIDDSAVMGDYHYPCVIYMREGGEPIGEIGPNMRKDRIEWANTHNTHIDPICSKNCLDVCQFYNDKFRDEHS